MSVPNLWDKLPEAPPAAELNPLTNPLLERNLRRWANVYFGNPPAKRERAVINLLEELKRESGSPASESTPSSRMLDARFMGVVCSACQHPNPSGHKYCSRCGGTLHSAPPAVTENSSLPRATESQMSSSGNPLSADPGSSNDVQWVQEQRFSGLSEFDTQPRRGWKYALAAAVIVLASVAYMQWNSWNKTRAASGVTTPEAQLSVAPAPLPKDSSTAEPNRPQEPSSQPTPDTETQKKSVLRPPAPATPDRAAVPDGVQPAAQRSPLLNAERPHQAATIEESGASDLRLAQRYLGAAGGTRDTSEAAKLLWKAVRKQNATAEVLLSDLYVKGDGVPQSCDQARLLLVAAAKRGSPQAAQQLRDLESRGCR
jgi:hypothetical protein